MNDQLQDIEQELMFKRNERRQSVRWIVFFIIEMTVIILSAFHSTESGLLSCGSMFFFAIAYSAYLKRKYPFKPSHLKQ